uniref:Immunogenic protein A n=1 Tax=Borrelia hermsii TaxID=140 RepID=D5I3M4_BORHE|nr:immunogenic protein A [Borrelia hermsii]ADF49594.1 immunogenic protein A [Borrelia hermsii]ADF49595.1 immunogenic protein A [Borrelia hermsii]
MDMRNLGIVIMFLSAFILSCKFYHTTSESNWGIDERGSVQDIRNSIAFELQNPDNIGQRSIIGGAVGNGVIGDQKGKSGGQEIKKDTAASGEGVDAESKQNASQKPGDSPQEEGADGASPRSGDSPQEGAASQEGIGSAPQEGAGDASQEGTGSASQKGDKSNLQGVIAAGGVSIGGSGAGTAVSDGNSSGSQEAESVDGKNVLADSKSVGTSNLDIKAPNLNVKVEGDISTSHETEGVIASGDLTNTTNTIITSEVATAASQAIVSGAEKGITAIKDAIAVVSGTQKGTEKETQKNSQKGTQTKTQKEAGKGIENIAAQNVKFAVLGTVNKIVNGVADGIANVIEHGLENGTNNKVKDGIKAASRGAGTFVTAAMQGAGVVLDSLQDVGNFVMDATRSMGDVFAGMGSGVSSVNSGMTVSLSSNETQTIERLAEYLQSAIKVNGDEASRQSKLENGRQKFFAWLKEKDIDFSKRKELVQGMQRVYDFIKEKSSNSRELQAWVLGVVGDDDTVVDVDKDDELNSDVEIDFLIKKTLSSRDYSGFAVSLLFQALADTFYDDSGRDKPEEQIFNALKAAFSDNSSEDGGFGEFKSIIEAKNQAEALN